jgi:hypothetical protein
VAGNAAVMRAITGTRGFPAMDLSDKLLAWQVEDRTLAFPAVAHCLPREVPESAEICS